MRSFFDNGAFFRRDDFIAQPYQANLEIYRSKFGFCRFIWKGYLGGYIHRSPDIHVDSRCFVMDVSG